MQYLDIWAKAGVLLALPLLVIGTACALLLGSLWAAAIIVLVLASLLLHLMALMVFAGTDGVCVCVCVCVCLRVRVVCVCVRVCAVQGAGSVTYIVYCWLLCCCKSWLSWCLQVRVVCVCVFAGIGGVYVCVCSARHK